ncbi:hypothetical protein DPEC_G00334230 [Dallia pectoralis]|uniref:Uncharacterized protein n=1 Tax=Dallia pectoralis TaxID=75939 RepID=A0ACC2F6N2_DALPE|nr:hypothetical protein DPEC_G00334230 [Dallia pectoralis]
MTSRVSRMGLYLLPTSKLLSNLPSHLSIRRAPVVRTVVETKCGGHRFPNRMKSDPRQMRQWYDLPHRQYPIVPHRQTWIEHLPQSRKSEERLVSADVLAPVLLARLFHVHLVNGLEVAPDMNLPLAASDVHYVKTVL